MTNPTITRGSDSVVFTWNPGDIIDISVAKDANLDENPLPGGDSDANFVIDFNGVSKTIRLTGKITPATTTRTSTGTTTTIAQQLAWLETLVNGAQTGHTLNTTFQSSKTVYCRSFEYKEMSGNPNFAEFTIDLVEGE